MRANCQQPSNCTAGKRGPCRACSTTVYRRTPKRWHPGSEEFDRAAEAYADPDKPVDDICTEFGTSRGHLMRLARQHEWPRRQPPLLVPLKKMSPKNRTLYRKVRAASSREQAEKAVFL